LDEDERRQVATMSEFDELCVMARRVLLDALDALRVRA
jgi:hypothetical protein